MTFSLIYRKAIQCRKSSSLILKSAPLIVQKRASTTTKSSPPIDFRKYPAIKQYSPPNGAQRIPLPRPAVGPLRGGPAVNRSPEDVNRSVRRKILIAFTLFGVAMVFNSIWLQPALNAESPSESNALFQGTDGIIKEMTVGGEQVDFVDSGTTSVGSLPARIFLPMRINAGISDMHHAAPDEILEEYTLVGHGIRTVSFLSIEVYVVAMYVATASLPNLQNSLLHALDIPSNASTATLPERDILRKKLLDETESVMLIESILNLKGDSSIKMALRIVPTRKTDFQHLRDGWVRGLTAKTKLRPELFDDERFIKALGQFKQMFGGKGSVGKGEVLILARNENGALSAYGPDENIGTTVPLVKSGKKKTAMHGLKPLGLVDDERVSRALWMTYMAGKNVASELARKSIADGMVSIVERPVGSMEGKVV